MLVPYENFLRLQFLIGDDVGEISDLCAAASVPCPDLDSLVDMQLDMVNSLPATVAGNLSGKAFPDGFVLDNIEALMQESWPWVQTTLPYAQKPPEVQAALECFLDPEVRIRMDSMILSKRCDPAEIAKALSGWSKYDISKDVVELYSFYFCNLEVMGGFQAWREYIKLVPSKQHQFFLGEAYDVQRDSDLLVLLNDLSVRDAVSVTSDLAVQELMMTSFIQIKKEEKKVSAGIPARNTAIFEWMEVYCKMFDRVRLALEEGNKVDALDRVRTNLRTIRKDVRKISELKVADARPG
jgi:hypothetical protein